MPRAPGSSPGGSNDRVAWSAGPSVFGPPPAWTTQAVPGFGGFFWAPDVAYFNGRYHLYYSVSSWGTIDSAIGLVTSPSLNNPAWTDHGKVVQSDATWDAGPNTDTTAFNAIDPSVLVDTNGSVWMAFGSYSSGILVTQLNPATGKRLNTGTLAGTLVANNAPGGGWGSSIEGASLEKRGGYYYLFVNYGGCCSGVDSTYEIRVGRGTSPTGPFIDQNGVDMRNGGGTLFLDDNGNRIGPGHFEMHTEAGQPDQFSYHYYDGNRNGAPTFGLNSLYWTADGWPSVAAVNPNWVGQAGTNWSNATNWARGPVPNGAGHVANFVTTGAGQHAVTIDGGGKTVSRINFASPAGYTVGAAAGFPLTLTPPAGYNQATINVSAGSHAVDAPITATGELGVNVTPAGGALTLRGRVTGTTLIKYGHGTLTLAGANTYTGNMLAKWGTLDVTGAVTARQFSSVGQIAGENATMTVRGTGSFTADADLNVGDSGDAATAATGTLNLRDSGRVTVNANGGFFVGSGFFANSRAEGAVNQSGGTLTANGNFDGAFVVGGRNSNLGVGTYNLSGGTVHANTNVRVGGAGTGTVNQTGGAFNANRNVSVGRSAGATGRWNITAGTLSHNNPTGFLTIGEAGNGTLTVGGGGRVSTNGVLRLGTSATGVGTVNLDGGVLTVPRVAGGAGTSTFNFNGGTLVAAAGGTGFMQGLDNTNVKAGGARIDTAGQNVTVAQVLRDGGGGGGVTKSGAGTLTLGARNTYTGPTTVAGGTLAFGASQRLSSLQVGAGGEAAVASGVGATVVTRSLAIAGNPGAWAGTFDLAGGAAAVDYGAAPDSPIRTVADQVSAAYRLGWDGEGITSSLADARSVGVGYAESSFALGPGGGTFGGEAVDGTAVLIRATPYGDANLDGVVSSVDLLAVRSNLGASGDRAVWQNGDFDYDGRVGARDVAILRRNFGATMPVLAAGGAIAAVPEPKVLAPLVSLLPLTMRRRHRRVPGPVPCGTPRLP